MPTGASLAADWALRGANTVPVCHPHAKHGRWRAATANRIGGAQRSFDRAPLSFCEAGQRRCAEVIHGVALPGRTRFAGGTDSVIPSMTIGWRGASAFLIW